MAGRIEMKLAELGIALPSPMPPIANYVPFVVTGNLVVVSGQVPAIDGKIAITGKVAAGLSIDRGKEAAQLCFINVLVHLKAACGGDLDRVRRVAYLALIASPARVHPARPGDERRVGSRGGGVRRGRSPCAPTIGVPGLPADAAVEVEGMFDQFS